MRKNLDELRDEARGITPATDYIILSGSGGWAVAGHRGGGAVQVCGSSSSKRAGRPYIHQPLP